MVAAVLDDDRRVAAGRHHGHFLTGKFRTDAVDDPVQHTGGAIDDAGAHAVFRSLADQRLWMLQRDGRKLGGPAAEGFQGDVDARQQQTAFVAAPLADDANGGGSAHVDGNNGRMKLFQRGDSFRHDICTYLALDGQADVQSGFYTRTHYHRRLAQQPGERFFHHEIQRRNHTAQNSAGDVGKTEMVQCEQIHQVDADQFN